MSAIQSLQHVSTQSNPTSQLESGLVPRQSPTAIETASLFVLPSQLDRFAQAWRRILADDRSSEDLFDVIAESFDRSSWTSLGCLTFDEFCRNYLHSDVEHVSDVLKRRFGKERYQLLVVAESRQGQRSDLGATSRHAGGKSPGLRTDSRTRAALVAIGNAPGLEELRSHGVLTLDEAAKLGGRGLSPEQCNSVQELGCRAKNLLKLGPKEARKEVRRLVEQIVGNLKPKESPLVCRVVGMDDDLLREILAAIPIDRLRSVLPPTILESENRLNPSTVESDESVNTDEQSEPSNDIRDQDTASPKEGNDDASDEPVELIAEDASGPIKSSVVIETSDTCLEVEPAPVVVEDPIVQVEIPSAIPCLLTLSDSEGTSTDDFGVSRSTWSLLEAAPRRAITQEDATALGLKGLDPDIEIADLGDASIMVLDGMGPVGAFVVGVISASRQVFRRSANSARLVPIKNVSNLNAGAVALCAYTPMSTMVAHVGISRVAADGSPSERVWVLTKGTHGDLVWLFGPSDSAAFGKSLDGWVTRWCVG